MTISPPLLRVDGLTKNFGDFRAVDGISFDVDRGQVVGLLGPNGAGKTTTIHMLLGLTSYDAGTVAYFGLDLQRNRTECLQRINFTSSYNSLQGRITVEQNLRVFAGLYDVPNARKTISELVDYFEIAELLHQEFWSLSAGQRTRVNLIKSLINSPELLLMDEPTASLDPDIADKTLSLIEEMRASRGLSILYTSHNMAEVTRVCDNVVFLDHGRVVAHDTPSELTRRIPTAELRLVLADGVRPALLQWLAAAAFDARELGSHGVTLTVADDAVAGTLTRIAAAGFALVDIEIRRPTLEDVFLQIARS